MLGSLILYLQGIRIMMFQLSGFYYMCRSAQCVYSDRDMGSCQNYGPFLGTLNIRCRIILRTQLRDPKST